LTELNNQLKAENSVIDWLVKAVDEDFNLAAGDYIRRFERLEKSYAKLLKNSTKGIADLNEQLT